jgi:hypothetical protein
MSIPFYGLPGNLEYQYTHSVNIRYPKVSVREAMNMHEEKGIESQFTELRVFLGVCTWLFIIP